MRFIDRSMFAVVLLALAAVCPADAHKASDAYLQLSRDGSALVVRWDISLRDLDAVLDLDRDGDRQLSWGEIRTRLPEIEAYALSRLRIQQGRCALAVASPAAVDDRVDGTYLVLQLRAAACEPAASLEIDYRLFGEVDPTHRGLLRIAGVAGAAPVLVSLDPAAGPVQVSDPGADPDASAPSTATTSTFFADGVHHIVIGYDHILFLICLLLPAVLHRRPGGWTPVTHWREAVWPMVGMVTMFTIAHSITLALAGLRIVELSPRIVEPGIALTIMVAAIDNLHPVLRGRRKLFAFLFGLIHGFGFASVLSELDLPLSGFAKALVTFNLGVEAGQLVIVTTALVVLMALRRWSRYPAVVLRGGSAVAVVVAAIWFFERVSDSKILPF